MAKSADVNNIGAPDDITFALKAVAKLAGFTVSKSGDSLVYNATGDQITVKAAGAGGWLNLRAWWVLREPGGRREYCIQRTSANQYRVKYSANAKFIGGAPNATTTPTATDEQVLLGSGTDAAPVGATWFDAGAARRYHIVVQSTPVSGAYYIGVAQTIVSSTTQTSGMFVVEPMAPGSYSATDGDPVVIACGFIGYGTGSAWYGYGTAGQIWALNTTVAVPGPFNGSLGVDIGDGGDVNGRPWYNGTVSGSVRIKGMGAFVAAKGPPRNYPATANTATDAYVYLGNYVYPYPDNTVPSVS
jgi:hypothetical protein